MAAPSHKSVLMLLCAMIIFSAVPCQSQPQVPNGLLSKVEQAIEKVKPALVRILVVSTEYSGGREVKSESSGSGVIISPEGYVVTNHHVAGHAVRLFCTLADRSEVEAQLIGTDALSDIAVIKLEPRAEGYPVAEFGDSSKIQVGDPVLAMGSPLALSQSVTLGIVSNAEMVMPDFFGDFGEFTLDGEDVGSIVLWIGHDASIFGGNSGGPLVDLEGRTIGINEIEMGLSGAIPSNLARDVADQLIKKGKVERSWLGAEIQPQLKSDRGSEGILISGVIRDTPAEKAGIRSGDRLIRLAGQPVKVQFKEEIPRFNQFAASLPAGQETEAVILRDGQEVHLKLTPVLREEAVPREKELKEWGITASNISFIAARERKRSSQEGVLVTSVRPGGPCGDAKPEIQDLDILTNVGGKKINSLEELITETSRLREGQKEPTPTLVEFERENKKYRTVVKVGIRDIEDTGREVRKPFIPISTQVLTADLATRLGVPGKKGICVTRIYNHPALKDVDLQVGDLILAIDGKEIPASEPGQTDVFPAMVRQYKVGATADLSIRRGTEELKVAIQLPETPKPPRELKKHIDRLFEFTVRDLAYMDKADQDWPADQPGVLVIEVISGGWAAVGKLNVGDLVLEFAGTPITDVESMKKRLEEVTREQPGTVTLLVRRGIYQRYLELEPEWETPSK
ncbi:MAG: putative periplasmic serine endoprotease DegP-like precursor [Candidatus Hinthialibacteria bacterium OLB16]|nr:MAG: putative periplasmic serine endoprotease DegP-like precursor [Candidatus Hinthialibacteria bacterium OLB16]